MTEEERAILRETLIRETAGLLVMAAVLWYLGPGKLWLSGMRHRTVTWWQARGGPVDVEVAQFRSEVSRWEHEQAAKADRRAGGCGPCGAS